jgi:hypothetical protein
MGLLARVRRAGARAARSRLDLVERLTTARALRDDGVQVPLADSATVRRWLRDMGPAETVLVHRAWGTLAARAGREDTVNVFLSDGASAWYAVPPGTHEAHPLTLGQVEHIVLDAMSSPERPAWPHWVELA